MRAGGRLSPANPGGNVAQSALFHTDGAYGLAATPPIGGNWFGRLLTSALDLSGYSKLQFDVRPSSTAGTRGEIAVQAGPDNTWCQGSLWAWTNAGGSKTISEDFNHISCGGVTVDPSQVRGVWVFVNGDIVDIDNIRAVK